MKKLSFTVLFLMIFSTSVWAKNTGKIIYAEVNGLVCDFCAQAIEKVFRQQKAVTAITVDLNTQIITIHLKKGETLTDKTITKLIEDSGYSVRNIRHEQ